jgi:hypothetical protein
VKAYRIVGWTDNFETAENRKLRHLTWVKLPTKQEGDGFTALMGDHPNGCAHFGAWTALVQLAAKCSTRGFLVRDLGGRVVPHDHASIRRITRVPTEVLLEAIPRLIEIGWLEEVEAQDFRTPAGLPSCPAGLPAEPDGLPGVRGEERRGDKKRGEGEESTPALPLASPSSDSSPPLEETPGERNRQRLLAFLTAYPACLEVKGQSIFDEWCRYSQGFLPEWVEGVMKAAKPPLKYPSELRDLLKKKSEQYKTWKANREDQG